MRAWNPLGDFPFPSDILVFTPSKNANKPDGVHSGTKLSTLRLVIRRQGRNSDMGKYLEKASVPQLPLYFAK